jgi:competence protein ComEA
VEPNATPWRVLEDAAPAVEPSTPANAPAGRAIPRSAILAAPGAVGLVGIAFFLAFGAGSTGSVVVDGGAPLPSPRSSDVGAAFVPGSAVPDGTLIVVEVVGAVDHPGVFRLSAGARVGDLVAAAGGFGARVDTERAAHDLNLAAPLHDGDQIRVPSRDDPAASARPTTGSGGAGGSGSGGGNGSGSGPISLNTATADELDTLPGIGPVTAAKIIASREETPFAAIDDLRTRKLVGEKTFGQIKDLVAVP